MILRMPVRMMILLSETGKRRRNFIKEDDKFDFGCWVQEPKPNHLPDVI